VPRRVKYGSERHNLAERTGLGVNGRKIYALKTVPWPKFSLIVPKFPLLHLGSSARLAECKQNFLRPLGIYDLYQRSLDQVEMPRKVVRPFCIFRISNSEAFVKWNPE
jgi:hypothetical protein